MPYEKEIANKTSHIDIVKNPDVQDFLKRCHKIDYPEDKEKKTISQIFSNPWKSHFKKPQNIISIDGSLYESSITEKFPSRKIGFIKIGVVLLKCELLENIRQDAPFIDPFEVAKFKENNESYTLILPSANIVYDNCEDVQESFRRALDEQFDKFRSEKNNPDSSLRMTLFKLASFSEGSSSEMIKLSKCPCCEKYENIVVSYAEIKSKGYSSCPHCGKPLYVTDILRVWEQVEGMISNISAMTRTMNVVERLIAIHYIRTIVEKSPESYTEALENICFFIDGPLAIFGEPAKLHSCIMKYLEKINIEMRKHGKTDILMMGIQKSGAVNDFFENIKEFVPNNSIYSLTDDYRDKYINFEKKPKSSNTYGAETYFGQDFLYKSKSGKVFVFNAPYPWLSKSSVQNFSLEKANIMNYKNIEVYTNLLNDFECELFENSLIPTVLAHKYTAISLAPGSKVLDLLAKSNILNQGAPLFDKKST